MTGDEDLANDVLAYILADDRLYDDYYYLINYTFTSFSDWRGKTMQQFIESFHFSGSSAWAGFCMGCVAVHDLSMTGSKEEGLKAASKYSIGYMAGMVAEDIFLSKIVGDDGKTNRKPKLMKTQGSNQDLYLDFRMEEQTNMLPPRIILVLGKKNLTNLDDILEMPLHIRIEKMNHQIGDPAYYHDEGITVGELSKKKLEELMNKHDW